ncbi:MULTISPECIES: hypothetical protein [Okeania]|uniref:hypothetical protein n=2 Tax=Microcoleaceae TaxID=1892252 RepID=UPI000F52E972|nr:MULTISPECIES: hypothetical protein [Okeania]NES91194.1 hypothetical protein [Okeania sp. SIO2B9]RQH08808.1 hypothetical protein D4Z78_29135 [Okeania hirsuta]
MVNKISATEFYDDLAAKYDDDWLNNSQYNVQLVNEAVKIFQRHDYRQGSILDIACGTGAISELLQGNFDIQVSIFLLRCWNMQLKGALKKETGDRRQETGDRRKITWG